MRRLFLVAGVVSLAMAMAAWAQATTQPAGGSFVFDPAHSSATFKIEHAGISWVAGRFNDIAGNCAIDPADANKCRFEVTIKTASVDTNNAQRDAHLRTKDFFDANQFPEMTFKSTSVSKAVVAIPLMPNCAATQPAPGIPADAAYVVVGDFTLHGVTRTITVPLRGGKETEFPKGTRRVGFFTDFSIKRSDFGMSTMLGGVGDEVRISISFEATAKP